MPGAFDFDSQPRKTERETHEKPATARRTRGRADDDSGGRSVNTALLVALLVLVMIGISIGGGAFYYYAVRLPWLREVERMRGFESENYSYIKSRMGYNEIGMWPPMDRESYKNAADHMEWVQGELKRLGVQPRHQIPPYQPPAGN